MDRKDEGEPLVSVDVMYPTKKVSIPQNNVYVRSVLYRVSKDPAFPVNSDVAHWAAWDNFGGLTTAITASSGHFNVTFAGSWKQVNLAAGTYYVRPTYAYQIGGTGTTHVHYGAVVTFTV